MGNGNYLGTFSTQIYQPNSQSEKSDKKNTIIYYLFCQKYERTTMAITNCLFLPTSENPRGFCLRQFASLVSVWCVLVKLSFNARNETIAKHVSGNLKRAQLLTLILTNCKYKNQL